MCLQNISDLHLANLLISDETKLKKKKIKKIINKKKIWNKTNNAKQDTFFVVYHGRSQIFYVFSGWLAACASINSFQRFCHAWQKKKSSQCTEYTSIYHVYVVTQIAVGDKNENEIHLKKFYAFIS